MPSSVIPASPRRTRKNDLTGAQLSGRLQSTSELRLAQTREPNSSRAPRPNRRGVLPFAPSAIPPAQPLQQAHTQMGAATRNRLAGKFTGGTMWWRPAHELRGCYGYWFLNPRLDLVEMSRLAARTVYSAFNFCPQQCEPANDRDSIRW